MLSEIFLKKCGSTKSANVKIRLLNKRLSNVSTESYISYKFWLWLVSDLAQTETLMYK